MLEQEAQFEQKTSPFSGRATLNTILSVVAANVFKDLGWLPYLVGFSLAYAVALLIEYWIPPKPPVSFLAWAGRILVYFVLILLGLWALPSLLSRWLWPPLAYGLPAFVSIVLIYWLPPIYPSKGKNDFWQWILYSLGAGLLFAILGYYKTYK